MGKFLKGLKRGFNKISKGVSRGVDNVIKGAKKIIRKKNEIAKDIENFADRAGFKNPIMSKKELKEFMKNNKGRTKAGRILAAISEGAKRGFQNVQAPAKAIAMLDPQRNTKMGKMGLSPMTLAGEIALAIPSSIGVIGQSIVDKKLRKKIKSGDSEAITNLALAPVAFAGMGLTSAPAKVAKAGVKGAIKGGGRSLAKVAGRFGK